MKSHEDSAPRPEAKLGGTLVRALEKIIDILRGHPALEFVLGVGIIIVLVFLSAANRIEASTLNILIGGFFVLAALALLLDAIISFAGHKIGKGKMNESVEKRKLLNRWLESLLQEEFESVKAQLSGMKPERPTRAAFMLYMEQEHRFDELETYLETHFGDRKPEGIS